MKRFAAMLLALLMMFIMAACSKNDAPEQDTTSDGGKVLVVVFSITGNTKNVADKIALIENADVFEITAEVPYTEEDLDYQLEDNRSKKEQADRSARPGIEGDLPDISAYDRIYIGFPIWNGEEPRIMDTFVENYDLSGKVMIPFCTSSESGIGNSGENLAEAAGSGDWKEGRRFPEEGASEDELKEWIESVK